MEKDNIAGSSPEASDNDGDPQSHDGQPTADQNQNQEQNQNQNQDQNQSWMSMPNRVKKLWPFGASGDDQSSQIRGADSNDDTENDGSNGGAKRAVATASKKRRGDSDVGRRRGEGEDRETSMELERLLGEMTSCEGRLEGLLDMQNEVDVRRVMADPETAGEPGEILQTLRSVDSLSDCFIVCWLLVVIGFEFSRDRNSFITILYQVRSKSVTNPCNVAKG